MKFLNTTYIIVGPDHVKELLDAPESVFSMRKSAADAIEAQYTFGGNVVTNTYHDAVIRTKLNRNVPELFPEIMDELKAAFEDEFVIIDGIGCHYSLTVDWTPVKFHEKALNITARVSNRIFVGLPLCITSDNRTYERPE